MQSESDLNAHLAATRAHIDSLRDEAARVGTNVDAALAARLSQVETERDTVQARLVRLQQATRQEWNGLQSGLTTMLDTLDTRVEDLRRALVSHRPAKR